MAVRCKLCRRQITDRSVRVRCRCGWTMDTWCAEAHVSFCPRDGEEAWLGAVEI